LLDNNFGKSKMRKIFSIINKFLIVFTSLGGVLLNLIFYKKDGYSSWGVRLLYFTNLSNIWIGITCLVLAILLIIKMVKGKDFIKGWMYILKYVFTVSITITGLVFCCLLAPNTNGTYQPWTFNSLLAHVFAPVFSIVDFFLDDYEIKFNKKHIFYTALPPFFYLIFASIFCILKVDFGRGDAFPYFFMNYYSPAGIFGFSDVKPFVIGSFYWIILFLILTLSLGLIYAKLHPTSLKLAKQKKLDKKQGKF